MSKKTILVIDDEKDLTGLIFRGLQAAGYEVITANDGMTGLRMAYENQPDLIILDIMMPELDGFETCRRLREASEVPILMLTAKTAKEDVIMGLETGADDYLRKPFVFKELLLRIKGILKRSSHASLVTQNSAIFDDGILKIDFDRQLVFKNQHLLHLTPTEYRLLSYLAVSPGQIFTHKEILSEVWGGGYLDAANSLSIYIRYLRQKIEDDPASPRYIRTQWGVGYWFAP